MSYHDDLFPLGIAYGARGGPEFHTTIQELASGFEKRNIDWERARAKYNVAYGVKTPEEMNELMNFFYARRGRAYSFPYYDHRDHTIGSQSIGTGDGVTQDFQIFKRYESGGYFYDRLITKIKPNTIGTVTVNGSPKIKDDVGADGYTLGLLTGIVHFNTAPALGESVVISTVEFYVHVRFDTDFADVQLLTYNAEAWTDIFVKEIKEDIAL